MADKKLIIGIDDTQFNQKISEMIKQVKDLQKMSASVEQLSKKVSPAGMPQMTPQVQQQLEESFKRQAENARKSANENRRELEGLLGKQKELLNILEEQNRAKREGSTIDAALISQTQSKIAENDRKIRERAGVESAYGKGGPKTPSIPTPKGNDIDPMSVIRSLGGITAVLGTVATAVNTYQILNTSKMMVASGQGSAMQGLYGREVEAMYSGRGLQEHAFFGEKQKALQIAKSMQYGDQLQYAVSSPIINAMANLGFEGAKQRRTADLARQLTENYNVTRQGLIEQDPFKKAAVEQYYSNSDRYLDFQRQTGLNYGSFHGQGGFREQVQGKGFEDELAMRMSQQIMAAGGSTGSAQSTNAILGLQAQRNFNLNNAGAILGNLGKTNANPNENKEALVRILAEGTKLGFDGSHYVEESRKFTQTVSEMVSRSGATAADDVERIARGLAAFTAEPGTTKGLEVAKNAYQTYQEESAQTSGARGVMRASYLLSNPKMKNMSMESMINLEGLKEEQLQEDDPRVTRAARESGYTDVKAFIRDFSQGNINAMTRRPTADIIRKINAYNEKNKTKITGQNYMNLGGEAQGLWEAATGAYAAEHPGMGKQELESYTQKGIYGEAGLRMPEQKTQKGLLESIREKLTSAAPTGKMEDETLKANALYANEILKNFRDVKDSLAPSIESLKEFNKTIRETAQALGKTGGIKNQTFEQDYNPAHIGQNLEKLYHLFTTGSFEEKGQPTLGPPASK